MWRGWEQNSYADLPWDYVDNLDLMQMIWLFPAIGFWLGAQEWVGLRLLSALVRCVGISSCLLWIVTRVWWCGSIIVAMFRKRRISVLVCGLNGGGKTTLLRVWESSIGRPKGPGTSRRTVVHVASWFLQVSDENKGWALKGSGAWSIRPLFRDMHRDDGYIFVANCLDTSTEKLVEAGFLFRDMLDAQELQDGRQPILVLLNHADSLAPEVDAKRIRSLFCVSLKLFDPWKQAARKATLEVLRRTGDFRSLPRDVVLIIAHMVFDGHDDDCWSPASEKEIAPQALEPINGHPVQVKFCSAVSKTGYRAGLEWIVQEVIKVGEPNID